MTNTPAPWSKSDRPDLYGRYSVLDGDRRVMAHYVPRNVVDLVVAAPALLEALRGVAPGHPLVVALSRP